MLRNGGREKNERRMKKEIVKTEEERGKEKRKEYVGKTEKRVLLSSINFRPAVRIINTRCMCGSVLRSRSWLNTCAERDEDELGGTCSAHGGNEKCVQNFVWRA
jgi:hypothetical protein